MRIRQVVIKRQSDTSDIRCESGLLMFCPRGFQPEASPCCCVARRSYLPIQTVGANREHALEVDDYIAMTFARPIEFVRDACKELIPLILIFPNDVPQLAVDCLVAPELFSGPGRAK